MSSNALHRCGSLHDRPYPFPASAERLLGALVIVVALAGCASDNLSSLGCPVGGEWCDCTSYGACDPGLSCLEGTSASGKDRVCRVPGEPPPGATLAPGTQPPQGSALAGLYSAYKDTRNRYFLLTSDGRFFSDKPQWRADGSFDFEASAALRPQDAGTFRVTQDAIVFSWSDRERSIELKRSARGEPSFAYGGTTYRPVHFSTVKQLDGAFLSRYSVTSGDPNDPMSSVTNIGRDIKIQFTANGQFAMDKMIVADFREGHRLITGTTSSYEGAGTYQIVGTLLRLSFTDGSVVEDIFAPLLTSAGSRDPNDDGFDLGFHIYLRR